MAILTLSAADKYVKAFQSWPVISLNGRRDERLLERMAVEGVYEPAVGPQSAWLSATKADLREADPRVIASTEHEGRLGGAQGTLRGAHGRRRDGSRRLRRRRRAAIRSRR